MEIKLNRLFYLRKGLIKLMMRTFIFLFCTTLFSLTPEYAMSQKDIIDIDADMVISVDAVFKIIKTQTDYSFVYQEDLFHDFPKVALKKGGIRLNTLLSRILSSRGIHVIFTTNNTILIKKKDKQQRRISGTVRDPSGLPVPGATVLIKGTTRGAATNIDGQYTITVSDPANILVFSSLGFEAQEITVGDHLPAGQAGTIINVVLKESISALGEVTIEAGYYKTSQREATGSISKIEAKTIEKQPVNNPLSAMQGHIPGVNIIQNTGVPGTGFRIQIRGQNFIDQGGTFGTSNEPLYIIDGVPYGSTTLEAVQTTVRGIITGGFVSPLNAINPADIKSIEVLKDADATAIYGSRGANGVVLITTKKGHVGKTQVKATISTTLSDAVGFIELMNTPQYRTMRIEALENSGYTLDDAPDNIINRSPDLFSWEAPNRYTDWQEVLIGNTAYRQNAQLALSGGSEYTQFLLSGGYSTETTVFPGDSKYDKTSLGFNLSHKSEDARFNINFSGNYNADTNSLPSNDFTLQARTLPPNAPPLYDDQGNINYWGGEDFNIQNPLAFLETEYNAVTQGLIANTILSYRPIPALEVKASLGYTDYRLDSYLAEPHTQFDSSEGTGITSETHSRLTKNTGSRRSWIIEPQINWNQDWEDFSIKALLGASFQQNTTEQLLLYGRGFSSNILMFDIKAANEILVRNSTESDYKYQSFFGRLNFNLKDTYILNLTGRRDGSSRFGPGNRYGLFGAIGGAYIFSEENFLKDNSTISFGKLRASYGIVGSDTSTDYAFYDTYEVAEIGLAPTRLFNPDFAWEETSKLEVALELGLLKNRIFLTAAWYKNRSYDQLINNTLPGTTGFSGILANFDAVVENKGFEIDLRSVNIRTDHFKWSTTFNISANENRLIAFPRIESSALAISRDLKLGESMRTLSRYRYLGINPETGIYQFEDYNNDGVLNRDDQLLRFDMEPDYFGGLGNTFKYKNLQLDVFFQFKKQLTSTYESGVRPGVTLNNQPISVLDRWQQPGDQNQFQRYYMVDSEASSAASNYAFSDVTVVDGSFIRLRNVSLNYTFPKSFIKDVDLSIYLQGQNLFVIAPLRTGNPEASGSGALPPLRQFTLGLNLGF